jgi:hypothetical protein
VPPDLYAYELGSQWEQDALEALAAAPQSTPPSSPPPAGRRRQRPEPAEQEQQPRASQGQDNGQGEASAPGAGSLEQQQHGGGSGEQQWGAWQAWEHWQAWQSFYHGSQQRPFGADGREEASGGVVASAVWQRAESSTCPSPTGSVDGDGWVGHSSGEARSGAPSTSSPDWAGSSSDGGLAVDDGQLNGHAAALLAGLQFASRPTAAARDPPTEPAAAKASGHGAAPAGSAACCCRCRRQEDYRAWQRDYTQWRGEFEAWQSWSAWAWSS